MSVKLDHNVFQWVVYCKLIKLHHNGKLIYSYLLETLANLSLQNKEGLPRKN